MGDRRRRAGVDKHTSSRWGAISVERDPQRGRIINQRDRCIELARADLSKRLALGDRLAVEAVHHQHRHEIGHRGWLEQYGIAAGGEFNRVG